MKNNYDSNFINEFMEMDILKKSTFVHPTTNKETVDLTSAPFKGSISKILYGSYYIVNEDSVMRPDVISLLTTGTEKNMDSIMRYNEVPNPFSIDLEDVFLLPNSFTDIKKLNNVEGKTNEKEKEDVYKIIKGQYDQNFNERNKGKNKNTLEDFKTKYRNLENGKDLESLKILSKNSKNPTKDMLPPVFSDDSKKEIKVLPNGDILPGESVVKPTNGCEVKFSKAELINKLMKSRIKRG